MHGEESITAVVALATLTIGILLIVAKLGGELVERILRLPPVLGELFCRHPHFTVRTGWIDVFWAWPRL